MIREERTVFLTILTFILYSIIQFWENGIFIFPFPLNELAILFVFLYFIYLNSKQLTIIWFFVGLLCLFKLLSQQFFWSIILPNDQLEVLFNGIMTDIFYLLYAISYVVFVILYTKEIPTNYLTLSRIAVLSCFSIGILLNQSILEIFSFILLYAISWKINLNPIFRSLIVLIFVLDIGKFYMSLISY
jgi:hypothetical protein